MKIIAPETLVHLPSRRLLALDVGEKTIGMATSDPSGTIATPIKTIKRSKFSKEVKELQMFIHAEKPVAIVVGYPMNMDGTAGPRAQSCRQFGLNLIKHVHVPIVLWDERLSTAAVERMMIEQADLSRTRRDELVDKLAASYMLQGLLDYLKNL